MIAIGDSTGKISIIKKGLMISLPHWHAYAISGLVFKDDTLMSVGKESVLVQWHLDR